MEYNKQQEMCVCACVCVYIYTYKMRIWITVEIHSMCKCVSGKNTEIVDSSLHVMHTQFQRIIECPLNVLNLIISDLKMNKIFFGDSLVAQLVKNLSVMQETPVRFLSREDPLEEGTPNHSSILSWRIPIDRGAWQATVHDVSKRQKWLSD